jgi:hypothetical protein
MIPGILKPTGNLSALEPAALVVSPIAGVAVSVGDIVRFDITPTASQNANTDQTTILDFDNKKNPLNVVVLGDAVVAGKEAGIWGVVTEAAPAKSRCKVCIHGIVKANVVSGATAIAIGDSLMAVANADLGAATSGSNPSVAIALETGTANATALINVLFNGYAFGSSAG